MYQTTSVHFIVSLITVAFITRQPASVGNLEHLEFLTWNKVSWAEGQKWTPDSRWMEDSCTIKTPWQLQFRDRIEWTSCTVFTKNCEATDKVFCLRHPFYKLWHIWMIFVVLTVCPKSWCFFQRIRHDAFQYAAVSPTFTPFNHSRYS
jgi:hypothetical protein